MSRVNADVIDVLENRQTRVEILNVDGKEVEDYVNSVVTKVYRHTIKFRHANYPQSDDYYMYVEILSSQSDPFTSFPLNLNLGGYTIKIHAQALNYYIGWVTLDISFITKSLEIVYLNNLDLTVNKINNGTATFVEDTVTEV